MKRIYYIRSKTIFKFWLALIIILISSSSWLLSQVQIGANNYGTLKAAFDAINAGTHTGNITVLITGNTTESETALLYASTFTSCTIRPSGGQRTISGNIDGNLVEIQSSNVTIDGSLTSGGTSKDLSISNGNSVATYMPVSVVFAIGTNCILKNTNVYCQANGVGYGVAMYYADNILIENCNIYKADIGIYAQAYPGLETDGYPSTNITIRKCKIGSISSTDKIRLRGIQLGRFIANQPLEDNVDGFTIEDNEILGLSNSNFSNSCYGIGCTNGVKNGAISRNRIHDIKNSVSGFGGYGMYIGWSTSGITTPNTGNVIIDNNMIYDYYTSSGAVMGIVVGYLDNLKIYHNSIYGYGSGSTSGNFSACIFINPTTSNVYCKNNILKNTISCTGAYGETVIFANVYSSGSFAELDYNDYYVSGTGTVNIGWWGGTYCASLSAWQTASSKEANGKNLDPAFISTTDLHLDGGTVGNSNFLAPAISEITKDFDNETRVTGTGSTTYIGADEVIPSLAYTQNINTLPGPICAGTPFTLSVNAQVTFADNVSRQYSIFWEWYKLPSSTPISGSNSNVFTRNPSVAGDAGTYYAKAIYGSLSATSNQSTVTIHTPAVITTNPDPLTYVCEGFPFDYPPSVTATGTVTGYQWQKQNPNTLQFEDIPGQTLNYLNIQVQDATQAMGKYRVLVYGGVCNTGPVISTETDIVVSVPLTNVYASFDEGFDPEYVCFGNPIIMHANGSGTIAGYQWEKYDAGTFYPIQNNPTATTATLVISESNEGNSGIYRCRVLGSANCLTPELYTQEITVRVWSLFQFIAQPVGKILCQGESYQLEVIPGGEVYRYRWQRDGKDIDLAENPTADEPILYIDNASFTQSGTYRCILSVTDCRGNVDVPTDEVLVYVITPPEITRQPRHQVTTEGGTVTVEVQAHVYNTGEPISKMQYQWYNDGVPLMDDEYISGSQQSILSIRNLQTSHFSDKYYCVVTGLCGSTQSDMFSISLKPIIDITLPPQNTAVCELENVSISVAARMTGGISMDYQWFKDGKKLENNEKISGVKDPTLNIISAVSQDAGNYYVEITVQPGNVKAVSDAAALTIKQLPGITQQPENKIDAQVGVEINLNVTVVGYEPISYQWYLNDEEIPGATNSMLTISSATFSDAGIYKCKVWNECQSLWSRPSVVNINPSNISSVDGEAVGQFRLSNMPNPFSDETIIGFVLPMEMHIRLSLTDIFGREVAILKEGLSQAGTTEIPVSSSVYRLSSGIYYYTLTANGVVATKKMVVVK